MKLIQLNPKQVEFEDKSGFNPLTYALRANMEKVAIKMIEVHPEILKKGYPLDYLSIGINKECEKFCLKLVEMINPKKLEELDRNGDGPLAYACRQRQDKLVTKIINKNPNTIKVLDRLKQLPLIDLYKAGKSEKLTLAGNYAFIPSCTPLLIQMLTLCPDAITLKDKKGKSLLYWCSVVHDEETMLEIIKIRPDTIEEQFSILQKYPKLIEIIKTKYPEFINKEFS